MRLLFVLTIFPKLSETFILDQITGLIDRGHEVKILSYLEPSDLDTKDSIVDEKVNKYGLMEKTVYLRRIMNKQSDYLDFQASGRLRIPISLSRLASNSDVIISHFADRPTQIASKLSRAVRVPYIFFAHARDIFVNPDPKGLKNLVLRASSVLVPSEYNRRYLVEMLGSQCKDRIQIVHCGIDPRIFKCSTKSRRRSFPFTILFVGRLVEKKGLRDALKAFSLVHAKYPYTCLKIIGDGPLKDELIETAFQLNISDHVLFSGACSHQTVQQAMRDADIFLLPACTAKDGDREGLPVVLLEASAMQLPVVSSYHTGIPEAIQEGESGFLVPEHNPQSLAERLGLLIDNASLRMSMGKKGREYVLRYFNQDAVIDRLVSILEETSTNGQGRSRVLLCRSK